MPAFTDLREDACACSYCLQPVPTCMNNLYAPAAGRVATQGLLYKALPETVITIAVDPKRMCTRMGQGKPRHQWRQAVAL